MNDNRLWFFTDNFIHFFKYFSLVALGKFFTKILFHFDNPCSLMLLTMAFLITITFFFSWWVLSNRVQLNELWFVIHDSWWGFEFFTTEFLFSWGFSRQDKIKIIGIINGFVTFKYRFFPYGSQSSQLILKKILFLNFQKTWSKLH